MTARQRRTTVKDPTVKQIKGAALLAVGLSVLAASAIVAAGCGRTVIEKDGLRVSDTQILRERAVEGAEYTRNADGAVSLKITGAKSSTGAAADLLRATADAIKATK